MIGMDDNVVGGSGQEGSPMEEGIDNSGKLQVFDGIVSFCVRESL